MPSWTTTLTWSSSDPVSSTQFNQYLRDDLDIANRGVVSFSFPGSISTGLSKDVWVAPWPVTVKNLFATITSTSTGSFTFTVLRNSTSIGTVSISSAKVASTATRPTVTSITSGDIVTCQANSTTGSDGIVQVSWVGA